jgi:dUTP pyrophosphatase
MNPHSFVVPVRHLTAFAKTPTYANDSDAGADLYASETVTILANEYKAVSTSLSIEIPSGFVGIVKDKSGLSLKGITTLAGVIDAGFRGEIKVVLHNVSTNPVVFEQGQKIAQLLFIPVYTAQFMQTDTATQTQRNTGGFGSSGKF